MQLVSITTDLVSSNLNQGEGYNIMCVGCDSVSVIIIGNFIIEVLV
jgi:hypothetical protein